MESLITRVRVLINDPSSTSQIFADQTIQDVLDASRLDVKNQVLRPLATFAASTIQFLDYYADVGDWEDDVVFKQFLVTVVTPSINEPIAGHWQFATTTLPPVYLSGKTYDIYRCSADLLERQAVQWALSYNVSVDGQNLQRGQVANALQKLALTYRAQQRPSTINLIRTDIHSVGNMAGAGLGAQEIDRMGSGDGR
jgi:hypothetical protein